MVLSITHSVLRVMLRVVMLSVALLSVVMLRVALLSVAILSVAILSVTMLSYVILCHYLEWNFAGCHNNQHSALSITTLSIIPLNTLCYSECHIAKCNLYRVSQISPLC